MSLARSASSADRFPPRVCVLAPEQIAQLNAMLAPIDSCLAKMKTSASRSTDKDEPEQPEAPKKPEGVQS